MTGYDPYTTERAKLKGFHEENIPEPEDGEPLRSIEYKDHPRISPLWGGRIRAEIRTMNTMLRKNEIGFGGAFEEDLEEAEKILKK